MPRMMFVLMGCFLLCVSQWAMAVTADQPVRADQWSSLAGPKVEESADKTADKDEGDKSDSDEAQLSAKDEAADQKAEQPEKAKKQAEPAKAEDSDDDAADKKADKKEDKTAEEKPEPKKPEPHKVEQKPLEIEVELDGTFVADQMHEVILRPETWKQYEVIEAVEHGARVKKGDVLVRFDDTKYEEALADASLEQRLGELSLMAAEEDFPRIEKSVELEYTDAKRSHQQLVDDIKRYKEVYRPLQVRIAKFNLRSSKEQLAMEQEELDQLRQMYEADELTEETEEIVLRRQRFAVETAKLYVEYAKYNFDYTMQVSLPRRDVMMDEALKQSKLLLERAEMEKTLGLSQQRYALEKKRQTRARSVEKHAKLLEDRGLMVLRAPASGVVYYGKFLDGKWSGSAAVKAKLQPFGTVTANAVLMTIVDPSDLSILSTISEKDLPDFKDGQSACIVPTGDDELEIKGEVAEVSVFPVSSGKFSTRIAFDKSQRPQWLVPGMTCKAKVTVYENPKAVLVPSDLVQTDEENKKKKYVMVYDEDEEEAVRRNVKLGRSKEKMVEILKGLKAGELIVKETKEKDKD